MNVFPVRSSEGSTPAAASVSQDFQVHPRGQATSIDNMARDCTEPLAAQEISISERNGQFGEKASTSSVATEKSNSQTPGEHSCDHRSRLVELEISVPAVLQSRDMGCQSATQDAMLALPQIMPFQSETRQECIKVASEDLLLAKAEHKEGTQETFDGSADTEEPKKIENNSGTKDGGAAKSTSQVGFKHDPDEENILASVELDDGTSSKKKRHKRRPKSQRGPNAPTGFEPFYADAPMTPQEHEQNKKIYDLALPILARIEEAIMRFLNKRLLSPERRKVFLKFLQYGGVSIGPKHSQGVTPSELKEMTKEEAMQARSHTAIFYNEGKGCKVAFNDVATGYLTGYYMGFYNPDTEDQIKECTDTVKNFFTYLLYHDVCPEHREDLEEARRTCDRAAKELWMNQQLVHHDGPGSFNRGCSMLFGGYYFDDVDDLETWKVIRPDEEIFTIEIARKIVKYGIAIAGNDRTAQKFKLLADRDAIKAKEVPDIDGFEIISVEQPSAETIAYYREMSPDLVPVGKVLAKEFRDPARGSFDLTPWEKVDWDAGFAPTYKFEFYVEPYLLAHMLPGMKVITAVYETNFGQYYFDEIMAVLPTFYKFLYNDWLIDWKEPVALDFVPDEDEIQRRRAQESILRPVEPTPAEWTLHMMVRELDFTPAPGQNPLDVVWEQINCLEGVGWDMQEIKELLGLVKPQQGKDELIKEEQSTKEDTSADENMINKGHSAKGKQAVRDMQDNEQAVENSNKLSFDWIFERDKTKPMLPPEIIKAFCDQKLEELVKRGEPIDAFETESQKKCLDRLIDSFHNPKKVKATLTPEFKESYRKYKLRQDLRNLELKKKELAEVLLKEREIREQLGEGNVDQNTQTSDE